jgi:hypothetical protein
MRSGRSVNLPKVPNRPTWGRPPDVITGSLAPKAALNNDYLSDECIYLASSFPLGINSGSNEEIEFIFDLCRVSGEHTAGALRSRALLPGEGHELTSIERLDDHPCHISHDMPG